LTSRKSLNLVPCFNLVVGILALGGFHTNYIICRNVENFKMLENEESFRMFQNVNMEIFKINQLIERHVLSLEAAICTMVFHKTMEATKSCITHKCNISL
jgi:hypothetical protein